MFPALLTRIFGSRNQRLLKVYDQTVARINSLESSLTPLSDQQLAGKTAEFRTRYGNGDPIGEDVVQLLNEVYEANTAREPWQAGDMMLVDNIRVAHSRDAYSGPREVLVAMADPVRLADCSPASGVTGR